MNLQKIKEKIPILKKWKWSQGRQSTGYQKMLLTSGTSSLPFDLWLLKYPQGSFIGWHLDDDHLEQGKRHFRLNIELKRAKKGGKFLSAMKPLFNVGRVVFFQPDLNVHCVTEILEGTRYVFSFGFLLDHEIDYEYFEDRDNTVFY